MTKYPFLVIVEAETPSQAQEVMAERLGYDEDYGFEYKVEWGAEYSYDNDNQIVLYTGIYDPDET